MNRREAIAAILGAPALPARSVIPHGDYCYNRVFTSGPVREPTEWERKFFQIFGNEQIGSVSFVDSVCPYWKAGENESAYCAYLGLHSEAYAEVWEGGNLIWDQVKECGVNK